MIVRSVIWRFFIPASLFLMVLSCSREEDKKEVGSLVDRGNSGANVRWSHLSDRSRDGSEFGVQDVFKWLEGEYSLGEKEAYFSDVVSPWIQGLDSNELEVLFISLAEAESFNEQRIARMALLRLFGDEPYMALELVERITIDASKGFTNVLSSKVDAVNAREIARWIAQSDDSDEVSRWVSSIMMTRVADIDLDLSIDTLKSIRGDGVDRMACFVLSRLARTEYERSLKILAELPVSDQDQVRSAILLGYARTHPDLAVSELRKHEGLLMDERLVRGLYSSWFRIDIAEAGSDLAGMSVPIIQEVLGGSGDNGSSHLENVLRESPDLGIELLDRLVLSTGNEKLFMQAARELGARDDNIGEAWLSDFPDSVSKNRLLSAYVSGKLTSGDPAVVASEVISGGLGGSPGVVQEVGKGWAKGNFDEAIAFVDSVPDGDRADYLLGCAKGVALSKPIPDVASVISSYQKYEGMLEHSNYQNFVAEAARRYALNDSGETVTWFENLNDPTKEAAISGVASGWMEKDLQGAAAWLSEMESGPVRDRGVRRLIDELEKTDPAMAKEWEKSLSGSGK